MRFFIFFTFFLSSCTAIHLKDQQGTDIKIVALFGDGAISADRGSSASWENSAATKTLANSVSAFQIHKTWSGAIKDVSNIASSSVKTLFKEREKTNRLKSSHEATIAITKSNNEKELETEKDRNRTSLEITENNNSASLQ